MLSGVLFWQFRHLLILFRSRPLRRAFSVRFTSAPPSASKNAGFVARQKITFLPTLLGFHMSEQHHSNSQPAPSRFAILLWKSRRREWIDKRIGLATAPQCRLRARS